jgi:hypothetical protein
MASSGQLSEIPHLVALIKTLTNPNLKDLLRNEGLAVSGVKASLQLRIIDCSLSLRFSLSARLISPRGYLYLFLGFFPGL